jgi:rSAM/selenodomain-associated transferase 1
LKKNAFILFLKYPEHGAVKTRLAKELGDDLTYELYQCFLADISAMTRQVKAQTIIVYSGSEGVSFSDFPDIQCIRQRGIDIGERMYHAFLDVFARGFERSVLIGSDRPDLPVGQVNDAFDKLDSVHVVLGPSTDGGYYLIGCKRQILDPSIFHNIHWSTANVFSETVKRIAESGLKFAQLPQWSDVDEFDDLKNFYERNINRSATSQVMKLLITKGLINESKS